MGQINPYDAPDSFQMCPGEFLKQKQIVETMVFENSNVHLNDHSSDAAKDLHLGIGAN